MDDSAIHDLVRDWEFESAIDSDNCTVHTFYVTDPAKGWWRRPREEKWEPKMRLGRGSFGDVWLQQCTSGLSAGNVRAVKEINATFDQSSVQAKFLSREISAIIKFSHTQYRDCFVPSFGWYRNLDSIFITMEYLPLGDLQSYLHHPLPEAEARTITQQVLQGLTFMHKSNYAHRDLKPKNILVQHKGPNWWVKISDFGCSKQNEFTALRTVVGTTPYLAPELQNIFVHTDMDLIASKTYSLAVDIWAIGAIVFRIATGRMPFELPMDLYRYVVMGDPFPIDNSLSAECNDFITAAMSGSPRRRPTAADALASSWILSPPALETLTTEISKLNVKLASVTPRNLQDGIEGSAAWSTMKPSSRNFMPDKSTTIRSESNRPIHIDPGASEEASAAWSTIRVPTTDSQGTNPFRAQMVNSTHGPLSPDTETHFGDLFSSDVEDERPTRRPLSPDTETHFGDLFSSDVEDDRPTQRPLSPDTEIHLAELFNPDVKNDKPAQRPLSPDTEIHLAKLFGSDERDEDPILPQEECLSIHSAAKSGDVEAFERLIKNGADAEAVDGTDHKTPMHLAAEYGHVEVVKLMLSMNYTSVINDRDASGFTPVLQASNQGHVEIVKLLTENNADCTITDSTGCTPLHVASAFGYLEVVKVLLKIERRANKGRRKDKFGRTPLFLAARHGHVDVVSFLASTDLFPINATDYQGSTALSAAARNGHVETVREMVKDGKTNLNTKDYFGRSAAWWAKCQGHVAVVKVLSRCARKRQSTLSFEGPSVWRLPFPFDTEESWCDGCLLTIPAGQLRYSCEVDDDLALCLACYRDGVHCLKPSHPLVLDEDEPDESESAGSESEELDND